MPYAKPGGYTAYSTPLMHQPILRMSRDVQASLSALSKYLPMILAAVLQLELRKQVADKCQLQRGSQNMVCLTGMAKGKDTSTLMFE